MFIFVSVVTITEDEKIPKSKVFILSFLVQYQNYSLQKISLSLFLEHFTHDDIVINFIVPP